MITAFIDPESSKNPPWLTIVNFFSAIAVVFCVFLCAKASVSNFILLRSKGLTISTMESCTGGQVASFITNAEGSSDVLKSSLVTYSNEAKAKHGVDPGIISVYGVYSSETAYAMAKAAMDDSGADIGIGITGTFRNPDPANGDSVTGVVNVVVCGSHVHHRTLLFIPHKNRMTDKIYVAQNVCEMIEKEIL